METRTYPKNTPRDFTHHKDHAGTGADRYSKASAKKFKKELRGNSNVKSIIMSNKKLIIGVAAGVAALAVTAIILKRKGYLDGIGEKCDELGAEIKDKYRSAKETARRKFDEVVNKGGELADKVKNEAADLKDNNPATA